MEIDQKIKEADSKPEVVIPDECGDSLWDKVLETNESAAAKLSSTLADREKKAEK